MGNTFLRFEWFTEYWGKKFAFDFVAIDWIDLDLCIMSAFFNINFHWFALLLDISFGDFVFIIKDAQLEIVLKIFHTMSDDIHNMDDKIKAQRRKDMLRTLNTHMEGLFTFFFGTLRYTATKLATEVSIIYPQTTFYEGITRD